jgi:hypothetical protein
MRSLCRLILAAGVLAVAAAVAAGNETPWHMTSSSSSSSSGLVAGTPQRVPADHARTGSQADGVASDEHAAPTWILVGVLIVGFGAVTVGMLRYRRQMQISLLRRFQRELERRSRARPPLVQRVADGR